MTRTAPILALLLPGLLLTGCNCDAPVAMTDDGGRDADVVSDAGDRDDAGPGTDGGGEDADTCVDLDSDGVTDCAGDCDDGDPLTYPGAPEVCGDGVDNACGSDPDPASLCAGIGTYVSPAGSDATGDGTRDNPVQTIGAGIANAVIIGGATTVVVAGGTYAETVTLVEGASIQGGFACASLPCDWAYDPSANETVIEPGMATGIEADDTITRATSVLDVTVRSMSTGVECFGAMTLRRARIDANQGMLSYGASASPLVEDSVVTATNGGLILEDAGEVRRCDVEGATAVSVRGPSLIEHNVIHGGEAGVWIGGDSTIEGNVINEDASRVGTCGFGFCSGIAVWGGSPTITNNVVYGGVGARSSAIGIVHGELLVDEPVIHSNTLYATRAAGGSSPGVNAGVSCQSFFGLAQFGELRNNIVIGTGSVTSYGYYEVDPSDPSTTCRPVLIENNLFFDVDHVARFYGMPETLYTAVADSDAQAWATSNHEGDPMLDASHHLMAGSPAIDQGTSTDAPSVDRNGHARPNGAGFDIGADERQ